MKQAIQFLFSVSLALTVTSSAPADDLEKNFVNPPDSARPGVYWYFLDGNLNGKEMTADLEAMKAAGLGNLVFLEVDLGMPKGPVRWMTGPWQDRFVQIINPHFPALRSDPLAFSGASRRKQTPSSSGFP
jgi:hypothetical protein